MTYLCNNSLGQRSNSYTDSLPHTQKMKTRFHMLRSASSRCRCTAALRARRRVAVAVAAAASPNGSSSAAAASAAASERTAAAAAAPTAAAAEPVIGVSGVRLTPRAPSPLSSAASVDFDGPLPGFPTAAGDAPLPPAAAAAGLELASSFSFSKGQLEILAALQESMLGCGNAFFGVALASVLLTIGAARGVGAAEAPAVLYAGVTVGDVASWADSLLVALLLRYGAESFARVGDAEPRKQLAYTWQGVSRLGLIFQQLAVAAGTVSIVCTLEAAAEWPPLVTLASGLFLGAALLRSAAMWYVLSKYGRKLDDVEGALEAHRNCVEAAARDDLPLVDGLAIRLAFNNLLWLGQGAGRRSDAAALVEGGRVPSPVAEQLLLSSSSPPPLASVNGAAAAVATAPAAAGAAVEPEQAAAGAPAVAAPLARAISALELAPAAAVEALRALPAAALPIIARSPAAAGDAAAAAALAVPPSTCGGAYALTPEEERLVQACQSSLNSAALALVLQSFSTGLLVVAALAGHNEPEFGEALADGISTVNKAVAAELIFVATTEIDKALYSEGCDVAHLLSALGGRGVTRLFQQLALLAWATVAAKVLALAAPWGEASPAFTYLNEMLGHRAGEFLLELEELLVRLLPRL